MAACVNYRLSLVSIGQVRPNPCWGMPPHEHAFHELIAVVGGHMTVHMPGQRFDAGPGTVLFYPAGVWHEEKSDRRRPVHTYFISFRCPISDAKVEWMARDPEGKTGDLLGWLFRERHGALIDDWRAVVAEAALLHYLRLVSYQEPDLVARTHAFMRSHLGEPIGLDSLAKAANLSRFHFAHEFRRMAGCPPMDDFRRMRAEAARDLLLDSNLHPKEIALEVGFANHPHLTRMMRRYLSTTPSACKRRVRRNRLVQIEDHG